MKKTLIIFSICSIIFACTSTDRTTETNDTTQAIENQTTAVEEIDTVTVVPAPTEAPISQTPSATVTTPAPKPEVKTTVAAKKVSKPESKPASTAKGEQLISKSDCLACHKINEQLVGPAYSAVAAKYSNTDANLNYLADKIISGGAGVWGEVPMSPHSALSKADAKEMARYILSLK
ncbi:MAG TPA: c-type cytochrome [Sphingobacteriaceae bacterium]|nr:c-type cytochrome [Sphingobacteriaceae bacterium]